ncbi:MAG: hypothetical protein GC146_16305 [Limimaricola sp.]|uniref:hypothetical protein n=1 Tax=Limimaricola sp. TaxID=2211665 RepID=UPI001D35A5CA|nr:hypothetical protein [Limimaricola sp.]MBI1418779.1 hypothetical protein [Limimaricola sp.]
MTDKRTTGTSAPANPNPAGTPNSPFDQMTILQALSEIQRDVATLNERTANLSTTANDMQKDMKEVRDRLRAAEVKIDHLPGKGFIVTSVLTALFLLGALITFRGDIVSLITHKP